MLDCERIASRGPHRTRVLVKEEAVRCRSADDTLFLAAPFVGRSGYRVELRSARYMAVFVCMYEAELSGLRPPPVGTLSDHIEKRIANLPPKHVERVGSLEMIVTTLEIMSRGM